MFHGPGCLCGMENISWLDLSPDTGSGAEKEDDPGQRNAAQADNESKT